MIKSYDVYGDSENTDFDLLEEDHRNQFISPESQSPPVCHCLLPIMMELPKLWPLGSEVTTTSAAAVNSPIGRW